MHRVVKRLGVQIRSMGFDNESAMINDLAATPRSLTQTCFAHGAGEIFNIRRLHFIYVVQIPKVYSNAIPLDFIHVHVALTSLNVVIASSSDNTVVCI